MNDASPRLFDYDDTAPLDLLERSAQTGLECKVRDIEYRGAGRVRALLVAPPLTLPVGRVLFLHPAPGDRTSFLKDARELASRGIASLLLDAPWSDPQFGLMMASQPPEESRERLIGAVVDARRGADLLTAGRPGEVAVVGHSLGALVAGILTGVDPRFKAAVLMAGVGSFTTIARLNAPDADPAWLDAFEQAMGPIDPVHYVRRASSTSFLFQCGLQDRLLRSEQVRYFDAAAGDKELRWYEADHYNVNEQGRADRIEWLDAASATML